MKKYLFTVLLGLSITSFVFSQYSLEMEIDFINNDTKFLGQKTDKYITGVSLTKNWETGEYVKTDGFFIIRHFIPISSQQNLDILYRIGDKIKIDTSKEPVLLIVKCAHFDTNLKEIMDWLHVFHGLSSIPYAMHTPAMKDGFYAAYQWDDVIITKINNQ